MMFSQFSRRLLLSRRLVLGAANPMTPMMLGAANPMVAFSQLLNPMVAFSQLLSSEDMKKKKKPIEKKKKKEADDIEKILNDDNKLKTRKLAIRSRSNERVCCICNLPFITSSVFKNLTCWSDYYDNYCSCGPAAVKGLTHLSCPGCKKNTFNQTKLACSKCSYCVPSKLVLEAAAAAAAAAEEEEKKKK